MLRQTEAEASENVRRLRALGVASVAPTHCTGELATKLFQAAYGEQFRTAGVGQRFTLD